ncbi:hypothetical protein C8R45DRAFT_1028474 [Mycena sanguinolenta]|nr:hypothetical protein C8R45DRAFT_1028474 [Mycena sanguinolenta]
MYSFNKRILITLSPLPSSVWCTVPDGSSPTLAPTNVSGCIFPYSYSQLVIHIRVQSFSTHDFTGEFGRPQHGKPCAKALSPYRLIRSPFL